MPEGDQRAAFDKGQPAARPIITAQYKSINREKANTSPNPNTNNK